MIKKERGITLIALVVAIILLIILASISIAMLRGESSIIGQTLNSKEQTEIATEKELIGIAVIEAVGQDENEMFEPDKFENRLNKNAGEDETEVTKEEEKLIVKFKDSNRYYEVDVEGNVKPLEIVMDQSPGDITKDQNEKTLKGDEDEPYEIWCIEDLVAFSQSIKTNTYSGKTIKLCKTLDFTSTLSYVNPETKQYDEFLGGDGSNKLMEQLSSNGNGFVPIGNSSNFSGTFDGQGKQIKNIYINRDGSAGLFSQAKDATIKNITITGEITGTSFAGGILAGGLACTGNTVENCTNNANISGKIMVGGIAGCVKTGNYINCKNYGTIYIEESNWQYGGVGGIAGYIGSNGTIQQCYNEGEVKGNFTAGGMVGCAESSDFSSCINNGDVHSTGSSANGGIIGWPRYGTININNCGNEATIGENSTGPAGGIVGNYVGSAYTHENVLNINNSYNKGTINSQNYCGGIIGKQDLVALTIELNIENCYSIGSISGKYCGGIIGRLTATSDRTTVTQSIKNTVYLIDSASKAIYSGTCSNEEDIRALTLEEMQNEGIINE